MSRLQRVTIIGLKVFFFGLLIHFVLYNFVTFVLHLSGTAMNVLRQWKEILSVAFFGVLLFYVIKYNDRKILFRDKTMKRMQISFIALLVITLLFTLLKHLSVVLFIEAFKYDFIGYFIFFTCYRLHRYLPEWTVGKLEKWYIAILQVMLILSLIRRCAIMVKPGVLKIFGYSTSTIEWQVGQQPPAVYRTDEHDGYPRNQFFFERPISRGFFLTAFFPLFYMYVLQRKSLRKTRFWRWVFALNVILTFSRAAWGAWVIELIILGIVNYRKHIKKYLLKVVLPVLIVLGVIAYLGKNQIINRSFSDTGHINLLVEWRHMFTSSPIIGKGAGYVGPASHWDNGIAFNPENQYLQIMIEFGIVGFALWMIIYAWLNWVGFGDFLKVRNTKDKNLDHHYRSVLAMSLGVLGLSISGLVLQSFTDRMIVYPLMAFFGLILAEHHARMHRNK